MRARCVPSRPCLMKPVRAGGTSTTTLGAAIARGRGWSAIESASILNEWGGRRTRFTRVRIRSSRGKGKDKAQDRGRSIFCTIIIITTASNRSRAIRGAWARPAAADRYRTCTVSCSITSPPFAWVWSTTHVTATAATPAAASVSTSTVAQQQQH
jgi:hypothetical protein